MEDDNGKNGHIDVEFGNEIVISGIAGRFPDSDNVKHLQENLFNKIDLGSDDCRRWQHDHAEIPKRTGKVNNIEKFDAEYFDVPFDQAHLLDAMTRCLLEHTYEAIVDAGVNPKDLHGTKTGLILAISQSEWENIVIYDKTQFASFKTLAGTKTMMPNWVSHWLGIKGPSYIIDTACSTSLYAMENAYRIIRSGGCDSMIVAGSHLCLHPLISLQYARIGILSSDGSCKPFCNDAKGYMRSETIAVVYLQKAKHAKRIYASLVHAKTNSDGFKEQSITFPSTEMQTRLMQEFYDECGISPSCIPYLEAHGTGTRLGDPEEVNAIKKVFCKSRRSPLLIGSVKSNLGHSEPAAGLCQIAKVIIAMETGVIPPNINFTKGRTDIDALEKGIIRVITDPTLWEPTFVGINSFGFGGTNAHLLLAPNMKEKINGGVPKDDLPRLIVLSGRTEQAVKSFLYEIENQQLDVEYVRLLHDLFADEMRDHPYRGYTIVESEISNNVINEVQHYSGERKPICFVFSGIGSQWLGMGKTLLRFPTFLKTVKRCDTILRSRGVHIIDILTSKQEATLDSVLNSIVGINVMQLGLIDLLISVNIMPDYVIGHSIGELCCGYVTGDFTIEQVILSAYYIGLALKEAKIMHYAMADINLDYKSAKDICPTDIKIICSYSSNTCSISGPTESIKEFAKKLKIDKIFYKEVNCCNIPLHSCYLAAVRDKIFDYLNPVIPQKMAHSNTWLELSCDTDLSYAEYFTNNLVNPVFLKEITKLIPKNAAFVEIAPDGILQDALTELFDATNIVLAQRDCKDNVKVFLQGLGKMYNCGLQPQLATLYPAIEFPVSRGTSMISPSIKWKHSEDWHVESFFTTKKIYSGERTVNISLEDEDYQYVNGHIVDGKYLLSGTEYICFIWETISMLWGQYKVPVVIEDLKFHRVTYISSQGSVELTLMMQKATGMFEITEGNTVVVTGRVRVSLDPDKERVPTDYLQEENNEEEIMDTRDIYKELKLRGLQYVGIYRSLISSSTTGSRGKIAWKNNWAVFMDNMMQMKILSTNTRNLHIVSSIQKFVINPKLHEQYIQNITTEDKQLSVRVYKNVNTIISGGVEISGMTTIPIYRRKPIVLPVLEVNRFVAHRDGAKISLKEGILLSTHLVLEYHQEIKINIIELIEADDEITAKRLASPLLVEILNNLPLIQPNITAVTRTNCLDHVTLPPGITISQSEKLPKDNNAVLVTGCNLLKSSKSETLKEVLQTLKSDGFLLTRGQSLTEKDVVSAERHNLVVVLEKQTENEHITLLKKRGQPISKTKVICVNNYEFSWLEELKSVLSAESELTTTTRIIIIGEKDAECGLLGLVNCLRKEPNGELIRGVFIQDENAPKFSIHNPFYAQQLQTDLVINVLRPGKIWGSYRYLPLVPLKPKLVHHAFVNQMVHGDLTSFCWIQGTITPDCQHGSLVNVIYSSLNFKDVMITTGKINIEDILSNERLEDCTIGFEYVGIDDAGRRVMGIYGTRCISNMLVADKYLSWEIPDQWSFEDAATVPFTYATCYYGLYLRGKLKKDEKILIHSGAGAAGQAAIHIALHDGCEVFTTVDTLEKRRFIRKNFPSIPQDHIGYSCDTSFEQMIYQQTNGRGVDVVLNSLAEDKLQASVRCLARGGRFLEIGKFDIMANNTLKMPIFSKGIQFYGVMIDIIFSATNEQKQYLNTVLATGINSGAVKPISRKVFQKDEVEAAFKNMTAGEDVGKTIIKIQEEKSIGTLFLALPRYYCLPNRSYIIIGGLGGFGMELADWLVTRGAENLVLISRTRIKNGYQHLKIKRWESYGVKVLIISNVDVSDVKDCEHILKVTEELAPTDAIFNVAAILNDRICSNHTVETFQESFKAKAWATKNMDQLSRNICPRLRHFVVFSTLSCGRGFPGQSNYGMSNSIMERICEKRSQEGLHGLAIQWGAIGDVGIVANLQKDEKDIVIAGTLQQKLISCIEKLEEFLQQEQPVVGSMVVAEKCLDSVNETNIVDTVANIIGLKDLSTLSYHVRLPEIGMDSMMVVEIKQSLEREHGVILSTQDIRNLTFAKLAEMIDQKPQNEKMLSGSALITNNLTGLQLLIRTMGKNSLISNVCVNLLTKGNSAKNEIFFLPGIEGCVNIFSLLAPKIEAPAVCLQYGAYNVGNNYHTISEIADYMLKHITDKIKSKRNFVIVAYSYGSVIGIELAKRLEQMNLRGRLVLIDGAPEHVKILANQYIPYNTVDELQNNTLLSAMNTLEPTGSAELLLELDKYNNWDDKLDMFINRFPPTYKKLSTDSIRAWCITIYNHIQAICEYDVTLTPKIVSPVILLKPTMQTLCSFNEDYGLHKITTGNIQVHWIEGDHVTMLDNDMIITTINEI